MYLNILHTIYSSIILKSWLKWKKRGYRVSTEWRDKNYRGQKAESYFNLEETNISSPIYKEHNEEYLLECIENLAGKGIKLDI